MSGDLPFGFGPTGGGGGEEPRSPFGSGAPFFAELERLLSWQGGPVNWELARQIAVRSLGDGASVVPVGEQHQVSEALRIADVWLDPVTALPSGATSAAGWSRVEWVEKTLPVWRTLCDPIATKVVEAMRTGISSGLSQLGGGGIELPEELRGALPPGVDLSALMGAGGPVMSMMNQVGGMLFGAQVGQAIGTLAAEVVSSTEVGLPLGPAGMAALVPAGVADFGAGLEIPADEVRIYLALRESASSRLFAHVPWLRAHVLGAVEEYARGIAVDTEAVGRVMRMVDPSALMNPERLSEALGEDVFNDATTPEQQAALARLELILALIEGWVDHVTDAAATGHLPGSAALREMVRRRRAEGGPGEQTFATLVGLSLRPRKLREAAALWAALAQARGRDGRDAVWEHPDLLPTSDDLGSPDGFVHTTSSGVLDDPIAEIEKLRDTPPAESGLSKGSAGRGPSGTGPAGDGPDATTTDGTTTDGTDAGDEGPSAQGPDGDRPDGTG
ncbi:zinc-dependent metalloprotease [Frankia sp. AgPm24]|uniref:zinc-dependent metalloprotease n=1 Tax=Frankia sp. AgPm24 TaxID=631128 RepID=UPI00200FD025|nr:zinc-dependent metalloprotease [Frankia sp. AgPm24]MCK9924061.1 zinc-dependent metalloprotease [Frankia sp. AgPm24]